jgi:flagellar biosynthesis regulator FlbT
VVAMKDKIKIVTLDTPNCDITKYINNLLELEEFDDFEKIISKKLDFSLSIKGLSEGEYDVIAMTGQELHGKELEMLQCECHVSGAITPRRPNMLLISENKIGYQPRSAIILCDQKIIRRQLRRARSDLRVLSTDAYKSINDFKKKYLNEFEKVAWMEEERQIGRIDGFITSKEIFEKLKLGGRRHTLLPDPKAGGDNHFLPIPYSDLIILLTRKSSPKSLIRRITEKEGETIWWIQNQIIGSLKHEELSNTSILVRHRKVKSLMEEAEKYKDLTMEQACHNSEGEVLDSEVHVEIKIEKISKNGKRTVGIHRIIPYSKFEYATISLIRDWEIMLQEVSQDVPKDSYYDNSATAFINLDE